jgi:uncharacterized RDD family membrane protein YckC
VTAPQDAAGAATPNPDPTARGACGPASLPLRIAAMVYDGVLLFGIAFAAVLVLLTLSGWTAPLSPGQRWILQGVVFAALGAYFCWCWIRSGQTLALKTWNLRVVDASGRNPSPGRAIGRYVLSWTMFVPGLAYIAIMEPSRAGGLVALVIGFLMTLVPALFDRERRLLHDRLSRTHIVRSR